MRTSLSALRPRAARREDGAAAVEFALIVPVLVILLFGIIEFGIAFAQKLALSNGARQGARYAAVPNFDNLGIPTTTCQTILSQVQSAASTIGMNSNSVAVTITSNGQQCTSNAKSVSDLGSTASNSPCKGATNGSNVRVEAKFVGNISVPFVTFGDVTLTGTGEYQCEYTS